jgi:catechol 2,3-dioxygenase-like lactoylglutathione lyase family enzyme
MATFPAMTHIALHVEDLQACIDFYAAYCAMRVCHRREEGGKSVVWMAEPDKEKIFILVLIPGGTGHKQQETDFSHLGFAMESEQAVNDIADKAREEGCLWWEPKSRPYPVGYYCGVRDPDGHAVEFSYGQPLGPGAPGRMDWEL